MPVFFRRLRSLSHDSGKYRRNATGLLAFSVLTERLTATRQLSCLPTWPQYCRATPTDSRPFLRKSRVVHNPCHHTDPDAALLVSQTPDTDPGETLRHSTARRQPHGAETGALRRTLSPASRRGHRFDTLTLTRQQQPRAIVLQRNVTISMPCGLRQAFNICRKALYLRAWRNVFAHKTILYQFFFCL